MSHHFLFSSAGLAVTKMIWKANEQNCLKIVRLAIFADSKKNYNDQFLTESLKIIK